MESWDSRHGDRQWAGEDSAHSPESGNVKDSWDQDSEAEEEPPKPVHATNKPASSKPTTKKSLKKICKEYDEKEKREEEEKQARRAKLKEELLVNATSDKIRRRKLQEAADLSLAKEVYGLVCPKSDDKIQT